MWIMKSTVLVLLIVGLCSAATVPSKAKANNKDKKDVKEKRDAANTGTAPYSYDIPQKPFHTPIHATAAQIHSAQPQPKYTHIEHTQAVQKVAPLEYAKQELSVAPVQHTQDVQQYQNAGDSYHPTTFHQNGQQAVQFHQNGQQAVQFHQNGQQSAAYHQSAQQYAPEVENTLAQAYKAYEDFAFTYPNYESFSQMPIVHYNGDFDKVTSSIVTIPGYSVKTNPIYQNVKASPSYSYVAPASYVSHTPSYSVPSSYSYPSQSAHYQSAPQSYVSAPYSYANTYAPASAHQTVSHSTHLPAALFVPETVAHKPSKVPDYATGSKGLGHYSSLTVAPISTHPSNSYVKNTYEVPSYTQTERPFKPSAFLGASHISGGDSYTEQSISLGHKPSYATEYSAPSKNYLPAKESYQFASHQPQVEYQIQYVQQQQPTKSYIPPVANSYLPPKSISYQQPKSTYLPPTVQPQAPSKNYLPAKVESTYLPPTKSYLPPSAPYQNQQYQHQSATPTAQSVHHQYQSQESYDAREYQSVVSQSGHK